MTKKNNLNQIRLMAIEYVGEEFWDQLRGKFYKINIFRNIQIQKLCRQVRAKIEIPSDHIRSQIKETND